jgi:penicillin-binding protein 1A
MAREDPRKSVFGRRGIYLPDEPRAHAEPPRRRSSLRFAVIAALTCLCFVIGLAFSYWLSELPDSTNLLAYEPGKDITLIDAKGHTIARRGLTQGEKVEVGELPSYVGNAFIAIEDRRFRSHFGIDPVGLARAAYTDFARGGFVQGGSTLTQQLAKNLFLRPDRTLNRKIEEALLAIRLENVYSKDEILTLYLNRVYFGAGVYGIEAASERFFGKPARQLSLIEAAVLAGSVKAPSRFNVAVSAEAALSRAVVVLDAMVEAGFIDSDTREAAAKTKPTIPRDLATPGAGYFIDYAISLVPALAGKAQERLIVETTLDLDLQGAAEKALTAGLTREGRRLSANQGAMVAMTPDGAVRALVGGRSYDESPFNRATEAMRQPGSAFKPFVYLAALEHGHKPGDEVFDGPVTVGNWRPDNYEGEYEGTITLAHALAHSSNSASVRLTDEVGPATVVSVAHRLGINAALHAVPSLALGTSEVTPLELTSGYAAFANGGTGVAPYVITRIRTISGKVLYERPGTSAARVMSPENNAEMTQMMMGTVFDGTGKAAALSGRAIAGKTGTSQDYRDAWFVGFSADYVCGVWIGNDGGAPMKKATGGGLPARIFKAFMTDAERGLPPQPLAGMVLIAADEPPPELPPEVSSPTSSDPVDEPPKSQRDNDLINAFEKLLDKLF